ncbi:MAG TPA: glycosyltransferase family 9 protein [Gemmatimonadaceae bacterium]|nr:glycosyltransferase family 9 protein [Gemmatimonadaceae bacterium]
MIHHISLLSYGDNLISLTLLSRLRDRSGIAIVGSAHTAQIAGFFPGLDIPVSVEFDSVPAFYDVRMRGVMAAVREAITFRRRMARWVRAGDSLILEHDDARSRALLRFPGVTLFEPKRVANVYEDRRSMLQTVFNQQIALEPARVLSAPPRRVTINPASRVRQKSMPSRILSVLVSSLKARDIEIQLIDPEQEHRALASRVDGHHVGTTLDEAVALIRRSDLYIGADSLLMHFAYYCGTPAIVLFNETNLYFAPPGVAEQGSYLEHVARATDDEFRASFDALLERPGLNPPTLHLFN